MSEDIQPSLRLAKELTPTERFQAIIARTLSGELMYPTKENLRARDLSMEAHPLDNLDEITAMQSGFQNFVDGSMHKANSKTPHHESHHGPELVTHDSHPHVHHSASERSNFCPWPRPAWKPTGLRKVV